MADKPDSKGDARVDLHIHSKYSDGNLSVEDIVERALHAELRAISITDHDSVGAIAHAQELGRSVNVEVISGVELSAELDGKDIHVLGYGINVEHPSLTGKIAEFRRARFLRAQKIVENLNRLGLDLRFETVLNIAGEGSLGRPHIAEALRQEEFITTFREAFEKYIGYDSPAYVEKLKFSPAEAFTLIRKAGGVPVLAHPQVTACDEQLGQFVEQGLMGLEVYHSEHSAESQAFYLKYCREHGLVYTGGSDCHGTRKERPLIGTIPVPYRCVEMIREAGRKVRETAV